MISMHIAPRLTSRLLLAKHKGEVVGIDEVVRDRNEALPGLYNSSVPDFSVDLFLPNSDPQTIKKLYREFVDDVSSFADEISQRNASWTMYNILTKRGETQQGRDEVASYFGQLDRNKYDRLLSVACDLEKAQRTKVSKAGGKKSAALFGADLEFARPAVCHAEFERLLSRSEQGAQNDMLSVEADNGNADSGASLSPEDVVNRLAKQAEGYLRQQTTCTFDTLQLADEVTTIIYTSKSDDILQGKLFDLLGEGGLEVIMEILTDVSSIRSVPENAVKDCIRMRQQGNAALQLIESDASLKNLSANQRKKLDKRIARQQQSLRGNAAMTSGVSGVATAAVDVDWLREAGFREEYLEQERMLGLQGGGSPAASTDSWLLNLAAEGTREYHEKRGLPSGTVRKTGDGFEEVDIPAPSKGKHGVRDDELISIDVLEDWAKPAFVGTKTFNPIQSKVFEVAYNSSENMLICAPTGAGKTNIAMLSFLNLVKQYVSLDGEIAKSGIKGIYIAPMKALAQEVVEKFSARLKPLGLIVREFTGDMQLSRQEVAESHLIVTTPEKWDVVTRKGGDGSLGTLVSLIIIDEVHLLAEDRGAVIETIVARTQRYIESSQSFVRMVGLSATLPNYEDVASFLRVNRSIGLFHFGPEFRPVPLRQTFVGVTEKQRVRRNNIMNRFAYEKTVTALENGKQVMIFVHSRRDTTKTLEALGELIAKNNSGTLFENIHHEKYSIWKKQVDKSRSQELISHFYKGMGCHHAGMLRSDRTLTEQLFERGVIKVLCCTATLAWGVNLPGHTVIIKGTELYDPERGGYVDLSILDVFQIFGRAGRPQYDTTGHAVMITPHQSLNNYLGMLTHQAPIESTFIKALPDHMNAEIVNGTINNIKEASAWLSYTFLFIRMLRNPLAYGMTYADLQEDSRLEAKRLELVRDAAGVLDRCMMIRYDMRSGNLAVTDLGRISSHYYIKHDTVEAFNTMLTAHLGHSDALHVLCSSTEFDQLKMRPEELAEMDELKKHTPISVKGPVEDTAGKVSVLLQNYIDQSRIKSFTLVSDTNYVAQNAGRISRALFEICLKRGWSSMAHLFLSLSKSIDRRMRMDQHPLRQFNELSRDIIERLEASNADIHRLVDMTPDEINQLCHVRSIGPKVLNLVHKLPYLDVNVSVQPITRGILRISLILVAQFEWQERYHGYVEPFYIWIEDTDNEYIYNSEQFLLHKKQLQDEHKLEFIIPIREPMPTQYFVKVVSDRWVGCENVLPVSFQHLILPDTHPPHTDLLDMHPVPVSALNHPLYESLYNSRFSYFNPVQSQTFHVLYHTDSNVLVGAPTGSGKTITAEIAILRMLSSSPGAKAVYIAPLKALARERLADWRRKLGETLGLTVVELTGDVTPDIALLKKSDVIITTPEKWDGITRGWTQRSYVKMVGLLIIDEIHLLGVDRGPVLEVIVSRMRYISDQTTRPVRIVGLSTALANARDLADWLGIQDVGMYNFRPSVRPIPMSIYIQGFPGKHYCPRMATMNKPAYASILEHSPEKPVLVFVSSRRQTRLTALDLIACCASDDNPKQFLHMSEDEICDISQTLRDGALQDTIVFGVGIHHAGLDTHDRTTVEELFCSGKIQILVCTSTLAWGVNFPAHLVIVKGTEYFDGKLKGYVDFPVTDVLQMMGRAGRPQFDDTGVACIFVHEPKKNFYRKFLHEPFPVESSLDKFIHNHINAEVACGRVSSLLDCVDYISWTYYFRRLLRNPSYYGLDSAEGEAVQEHLLCLLRSTLRDLEAAGCVVLDGNDVSVIRPTVLGMIASTYYLDYRTLFLFRTRLNSYDVQNGEGNIEDLVLLLSEAREFSELPVRHNEEHLNASLADSLPWASDHLDMESSHTKAYLLLQAHFFQVKLPISDYITDTKSVLDQAPRVLNGMIDVAADAGQLELTLRLIRIAQMIVQGLEEDASQLMQLPHMSLSACRKFSEWYGVSTLKQLAALPSAKFKEAVSRVLNNEKHRQELSKVFVSLPRVKSMKVTLKRHGGTELQLPRGGNESEYIAELGEELEVEIATQSEGKGSRDGVYCPRYHKAKAVSWWLVLGSTDGELVAMKRVGSLGQHSSRHSLLFSASADFSDEVNSYVVLLIPDSVYGIEMFDKFTLNIATDAEHSVVV